MIKRLAELLLSFFGLVLLSPVFLVVAICIWLEDRGPAFFVQTRIGRNHRPFRMYKFRSMQNVNQGPSLTVGNDSRITKIGRILRKTKIDEFPQLWNVLVGEMSLVGPRPEVETYVSLYSAEQKRVLELKPGITDPASLAMYDEAKLLSRASNPEEFYIQKVMPEKIRINLEYANKAGVITDFLVIAATLARALGFSINIFTWLKLEPANLEVNS